MLIFSFLFLPYFQYHGLVRSWNFATMATWRNDFFFVVVRVPWKYRPEKKYLAAILYVFFAQNGVTLVRIGLYVRWTLWLLNTRRGFNGV